MPRLPDIKRILLTHDHLDHVGGLAELVERTRAAVGAHPLAQAGLNVERSW